MLPEDARGLELSNGGTYAERPDATEGPVEELGGLIDENRIVAISAHTQIEVVEEMAERLQEVSAEKWSAALPESVIED